MTAAPFTPADEIERRYDDERLKRLAELGSGAQLVPGTKLARLT
jgi:hypothetical protein